MSGWIEVQHTSWNGPKVGDRFTDLRSRVGRVARILHETPDWIAFVVEFFPGHTHTYTFRRQWTEVAIEPIEAAP